MDWVSEAEALSIPEVNSSDYGISDDEMEGVVSGTVWLDSEISSTVKFGPTRITRQCIVEALESIDSGMPAYWPVPQDKRAYLLDLSDPKHEVYDKNGKLLPVDALIKNNVCNFCF